MNRDDIIKWAREAGFMFCEESYKHRSNCLFYGGYAVDEQLERFFHMAQAAEREARSMRWDELIAKAVLAEREACAEVCDGEATIEGIAQRCAAAIRARKD